MISDKLYTLAFEYKRTKLWKKLSDTEMFAVRLPEDRIGYISVMGMAGGHCALGLYIGEEGLNSFRRMAKADWAAMNPFTFQEQFLQQNCLQCVFLGKDELSEEEKAGVKEYARSHGIRIAGKNAYPQFVRYQPGYYPWHIEEEREQEELCEALKAAIAMAGLLEERKPEELNLLAVGDNTREIPLLERQGETYHLGKAELPEVKPVSWPQPKTCNEIGIANLKKIKRVGIWECGIVQFPEPVQNKRNEAPVFPLVLLVAETESKYMLPISPVIHYEENSEELLNLMIESFLREEFCPMEIRVRDARTYAFVKIFCDKLKIKLSMEQELPVLSEVEYEFFRHFSMTEEEELREMLDTLGDALKTGEVELGQLPDELVEQLGVLMQQGALPKEIEERIEEIFHFEEKSGARLKKSDFKTVKGKLDLP
ncbi:MAG: hypothetical protein HFH48_01550 [Lachnospiraceae bacterium]|nr:hypothetical protein [Lachnospiraceae bacterium]